MVKADSKEKRRSDAEVFEEVKSMTLAEMERFLAMRAAGQTLEDYFALQRKKGIEQEYVPVQGTEVREIGSFKHDPSGLRQWVYRSRTDPDSDYMMSWTTRFRLQQDDKTVISAFKMKTN